MSDATGQAPDARGAPELRVCDGLAGSRLDHALAGLVAEGLRGRRRRIAGGRVLLNGSPCLEPARRVRPGDVLALAGPADEAAPLPQTAARLLTRRGDACVVFKAAGLPSAALAGKGGDSLEARLAALSAPVLRPGERPLLLQRLDTGTSGLVCAALTREAARAFRAAEAAGECEKRYLAVLEGALDGPVTARRGLDTRQRRKSRVLAADAGPLRWTEFLPLHVWRGEACARLWAQLTNEGEPGESCPRPAGQEGPQALTLAGCRIRRGARHQIRAHAALLGHPLLGDTRYGAHAPAPPVPGGDDSRFFLHHGFLAWPGGTCSVAPPWPWLEALLPPGALLRVRDWLRPQTPAQTGSLRKDLAMARRMG